jgi:hypothetical protein
MKTKPEPACRVDYNGTKRWYLNGRRHREDGPAVEYANGAKFWYLNGKLHREDGPAIEYTNGEKYWYLNDKRLTEKEFNEIMNKTKPIIRKTNTTPTENYWVIDTDSPGNNLKEFSAMGPYPTQAAAERAIIEDTSRLWEDSCTCLTADKTRAWCKPLHIVKVLRTVQPKITANVKLENI